MPSSENNPKPGAFARWREQHPLLARWAIVYTLAIIAMVLLILDTVPQLRGYKPWPPEWQWTRRNGTNLWGVVPMGLAGFLTILAGWFMDKGAQTRWRQIFWVCAIVLGSFTFHVGSYFVRTLEIGHNIGPRTSVHYFEDFFEAAQKIDKPAKAFSEYEYIREHYNRLRIATHPPGLIYVYRIILDFSEWSQPELKPFADWCKGFFRYDWIAKDFSPAHCMALFLVSLFKLLAGQLGILGIWLILQVFPGGPSIAGRSLALFTLVPGMIIFSLSLDAILAGLSALSIGFLLASVAASKHRIVLAIAAGVCGFLQSMLAFQVATTALLGFFAVVVYTWHRHPGVRETARRLWMPIVVSGATALMLWLVQYAATGYFFIVYLLEGIAFHNKGPIHMHRSRIGWLFFNQWDVFFFTGLAWIPFWFRKKTWCPFARNPLLYAFLFVWVLIHLADGIRGETARLVMFAYPILVVALTTRNPELLRKGDYFALAILLCGQTLVFAATLCVYFP